MTVGTGIAPVRGLAPFADFTAGGDFHSAPKNIRFVLLYRAARKLSTVCAPPAQSAIGTGLFRPCSLAKSLFGKFFRNLLTFFRESLIIIVTLESGAFPERATPRQPQGGAVFFITLFFGKAVDIFPKMAYNNSDPERVSRFRGLGIVLIGFVRSVFLLQNV